MRISGRVYTIMFSHLALSAIFILSSIVPASISDSDLLWPPENVNLFSDANFFSDTESSSIPAGSSSDQALLPLDQTGLLFGSTQLPGDSESFLPDTDPTDSLFGNAESSTPIGSESFDGGSFNLAGCSASEDFPAIGKNRLTRRDGSGTCTNPDTTSPKAAGHVPGGLDGPLDPDKFNELLDLLKDPEMKEILNQAQANKDHNTYCHILTAGLLPWGVCSSGRLVDETSSSFPMVFLGLSSFVQYTLDWCTLGTFSSSSSSSSFFSMEKKSKFFTDIHPNVRIILFAKTRD